MQFVGQWLVRKIVALLTWVRFPADCPKMQTIELPEKTG